MSDMEALQEEAERLESEGEVFSFSATALAEWAYYFGVEVDDLEGAASDAEMQYIGGDLEEYCEELIAQESSDVNPYLERYITRAAEDMAADSLAAGVVDEHDGHYFWAN